MDEIQLFTAALGASLLLLGWTLTVANWSNWKRPRKPSKTQAEEVLIQARLGRRLHMSIVLVGLGFAVILGAFLGREKMTAFYWYGVVALALWMSLLAIFDGSATWSHVIRVRRELAKKRKSIMSDLASRQARVRELNQLSNPPTESPDGDR